MMRRVSPYAQTCQDQLRACVQGIFCTLANHASCKHRSTNVRQLFISFRRHGEAPCQWLLILQGITSSTVTCTCWWPSTQQPLGFKSIRRSFLTNSWGFGTPGCGPTLHQSRGPAARLLGTSPLPQNVSMPCKPIDAACTSCCGRMLVRDRAPKS